MVKPPRRAPQHAEPRPTNRTDTRARLLEAAGEVFAAQGFRAATVAAICRRAGANIGAINYYFGSKASLYVEVFRWVQRHAAHDGLDLVANDPAASPEQRLHAVVKAFMASALGAGRPAWEEILIAREMAEPTSAMRKVFLKEIRARHERMIAILAALAEGRLGAEELALSAFSVAGQCLFYRMALTVIRSIGASQPGLQEPERVADHITSFTIGAIRGLMQAKDAS